MSQNYGYHIANIERGEFGELSKILEEVNEAIDAESQGCKIMILVELSDMLGAIEGYLQKHHKDITLDDLHKMSQITKRAFKNGHR